MKWLLRLYPRYWRNRYGDEFLALLEQNGVSMLDLVDILMGAAIARIRPSAAVTADASRTGGRAFMLAALIWLTVPPALTNLTFYLGLDEAHTALMHTGTLLLTLVLVGYARYRHRIDHQGRALTVITLVYRVVVVAWLVYLLADGLVSTHVLSVWGPVLNLVALGVFSTILCCLSLTACISTVKRTLPWWAALPLIVIPPLGGVSLTTFIMTSQDGSVAPSWTQAVYMGFYVMIGISWLLLGLALLGGSGQEPGHASGAYPTHR